jgi:hypothetical protein
VWCEFFDFFCFLLPMLETIHALINFVEKWNIFVCDYVTTIKICQGQLYFHYSNSTRKYVFDVLKKFQDLVVCIHITMHLKWKACSLDLNMFYVDYLCFDSSSFIFGLRVYNPMVRISKWPKRFHYFYGWCRSILLKYMHTFELWF